MLVDTQVSRVQTTSARARPTSHALQGQGRRASCRASCASAAFALRFGDWNLLSRVRSTRTRKLLMQRDIRSAGHEARAVPPVRRRPVPGRARRTHRVGPRRVHDHRPSTRTRSRSPERAEGSGLDADFNYVRNSVKATVDAYDGTVKFYVVDTKDPIIKAYRKAFPDLFTDVVDDAGRSCATHLRYPEDLFKAQTEQYAPYHMTEPRSASTTSSAMLAIVARPRIGRRARRSDVDGREPAAATTAGATRRIGDVDGQPDRPAATSRCSCRGRIEQELHRSSAVRAGVVGNSQTRLVSFLTANSDPDHYGQLRRSRCRQGQTVDGPGAGRTTRSSAPRRSRTAFTLLDQQGSQVIQGSMQLIPVGNSIVYVRPIYAQGRRRGQLPAVPVRRRLRAGLRRRAAARRCSDGLDQLLGAAPTTTCNASSGRSRRHRHGAGHDDHDDHHRRRSRTHDDRRPRRPRPRRSRRADRERAASCSTRRPPSSTRPQAALDGRRPRPRTSSRVEPTARTLGEATAQATTHGRRQARPARPAPGLVGPARGLLLST